MKNYTVFVGYDIPLALEVKHSQVLPLFDQHFTPHELEGDMVHIVPESEMEKAEEIIENYNEKYDIGLTCDFEEYEKHK
ncbi:hypothetical protein IMZ31_23800 (plasmid) [Pontibacillus sp. ALD_SL1]|uniref:hypothetical protein n=1 Tax=Pontibacillus sp. ALD_SL1 TaxID=2777185 RepID=UPI001A977E1F|nr:hypothetical protein [Pontibacillus sp. ALD_SL1]QST02477.1 hypothetical protein IMZ31_23800 [Pontibacillus sp. ALD_SL1]